MEQFLSFYWYTKIKRFGDVILNQLLKETYISEKLLSAESEKLKEKKRAEIKIFKTKDKKI